MLHFRVEFAASIIEALSSTKNKQQHDPEMHQTKKGNQWYFGMKAHIGVDAKSGLAPDREANSPDHEAGADWTGVRERA